jgi:hypothetical protein
MHNKFIIIQTSIAANPDIQYRFTILQIMYNPKAVTGEKPIIFRQFSGIIIQH